MRTNRRDRGRPDFLSPDLIGPLTRRRSADGRCTTFVRRAGNQGISLEHRARAQRRTVIFRVVLARATSASSSNVRPRMHTPVQHRPVPASTLPSVIAASPSDRYALATAAGPQRDPFDCQVSRRLKVAAIGSATRAPQALACASPTTRWPVATPWIARRPEPEPRHRADRRRQGYQ